MQNKKWNELYQNENQLVEAFAEIDLARYQRIGCNGWSYIEGFQKYYKKNGELTPKQMTQLKRLANEIYKYHNAHSINGATGEKVRYN